MTELELTINATSAPIKLGDIELQSAPIAIENLGIVLPGPKGDKGDPSEMLPATTETIGGVKVGSGLLISDDGTLSVDKSQIHEVPAGGEQNQVMKKMSGTDYDYGWGDSVIIEAVGSTLTIF